MAPIFKLKKRRVASLSKRLSEIQTVSSGTSIPVSPLPLSNILGSLTRSLSSLSSIGTGVLGVVTQGSLNQTLQSLSRSVSGTLNLKGSVTRTLNSLTALSNASSNRLASVTKTLRNSTSSAFGFIPRFASVNKLLRNATASSVGLHNHFGSVNKTLRSATLSASNTVSSPANILVGLNIEPSYYYSFSPTIKDWAQQSSDLLSFPSARVIPAANLNSEGQVISLPTGDTYYRFGVNTPEHASSSTPVQLHISWTPGAFSVAEPWPGNLLGWDTVSLAAGTGILTVNFDWLTQAGFGINVTPVPGVLCTFFHAYLTGESSGFNSNFQSQITSFVSPGASLRHLDRVGVNNNQGFYIYGQIDHTVGGRHPFPTSGLLSSTLRNVPNSPDWVPKSGFREYSGGNDYLGRKNDGTPIEELIAEHNALNLPLHFNLPWNCDDSYINTFVDLVCSTLVPEARVEVANEVWNGGFPVNNQARNEAFNRLYLAGTTTLLDASQGMGAPYEFQDGSMKQDPINGAAERYCEKTIEVAKKIKARCLTNGKAGNFIKTGFAWQSAADGVNFAKYLDYVPRGPGGPTIDGTAVKDNIHLVWTASYFEQGTIPFNIPPDPDALFDACCDYIDILGPLIGRIDTVCSARGLPLHLYEGGVSIYFNSNGNEIFYPVGQPTALPATAGQTVQEYLSRHPRMYDTQMYWLDRMNHVLRSGAVVTVYHNCGLPNGRFGQWGTIERSTDMETLSLSRPKAMGLKNWKLGQRKLQSLSGQLFVAAGSPVGQIVGTLRRRTFGSSVAITTTPAANALSILNPTGEILQIAVASASAVASAGTIAWTVTETDARDPAVSRLTTGNCAVISTPIWDSGTSSSYYSITNNGLTATLTGNPSIDNLVMSARASSAADRSFSVHVNHREGNMGIGLCAAGSASTGVQPICHYYSGGILVDNSGGPWTMGLATYTTNDDIVFRIKNGKVYIAKNGVYQNGANPTTEVNGIVIPGLTTALVPCADLTGINDQVTADFTNWT